ncbi:molybdopterin-dependent oxidoreductase [Nocardioides sp.]|uniref:molybdopterin-dependent oxidoreductase n=1 Tax=Nocardioides sp. TaxID=35761 RepID=UPI00286D04BC|nr:molybdopterin-dependent oxidoreductase [Nocardioides sp.]
MSTITPGPVAQPTVVPTVVQRQCPLCEAHCGIRVTVQDNEVLRIEGDPDDVLSRGYVCPKGTALKALHDDPERLRTPLRRVGDGFEEIGWAEAFDLAGRRLRAVRREHGRDAVGAYFGNPTAHSTAVFAIEGLKKVLRSRNVFSASSIDQFPQYLASELMFGDHTILPIMDIDHTDHLLVLGANPAVSNGSITTMPDARRRMKDVVARGGRVVVVDPRRTETARLASEHVAIKPGGDPHLLLAMLHVVLRDGLDRVPAWASGLDDVRRVVADRTPERAAAACGVDAPTIERLARDFALARSAVAYGRLGVCHHTTGTVTHWLINVLNVVTGNLDRTGGAMFTTPPVDLGRVLRMLWGASSHGTYRSRGAGLPDLNGELPVAAMADELTRPGPGRVRALVVASGNPALSAPDGRAVHEALQGLDFLVCVDLYLTETSRLADLVLPPISQLERSELDVVFPAFSVRNNARWSPRAIEPAPDALEDWDILLGLAAEQLSGPGSGLLRRVVRRVLGVVDAHQVTSLLILLGPQGPFSKARGSRLPRGRRGLTARRVRSTPGGIDLGPLEPRLPGILRTQDRTVHLAPAELLDALSEALPPAPHGGRPETEADGFDLQLIGRRHLRSNNSWLHNVPAMVKGAERCTALMHPDDAASRTLSTGDVVEVTSRVGSIRLPLEVSDEVRPGVVSIPHGWGHDAEGSGWSTASARPGVNVNLLTDSTLVDALSGNAAVNATRVRVAQAS